MLPRVTDCGENEPVLEDLSSDEENCDDIHTDSSEAGSEINDSDASDPDFFTNNDCAMPCMHQVRIKINCVLEIFHLRKFFI